MNYAKSAPTLVVRREFSVTPGPRSPDEGSWSGESFLKDVLRPKFVQALANGTPLLVDLDGTEGYATSFLEAAFGGLAREFDPKQVMALLHFICDDEPFLEDEIRGYIKEARDR